MANLKIRMVVVFAARKCPETGSLGRVELAQANGTAKLSVGDSVAAKASKSSMDFLHQTFTGRKIQS